MNVYYSFFILDCNLSNKNLFVEETLFLQKIRPPVLVSYKLELKICLIILDVSQKFSSVCHNTEAAFRRCFTKLFVQQNDVMKYSSSAPVVKIRKALHTNLLKIAPHQTYFSKNLTTISEQRY